MNAIGSRYLTIWVSTSTWMEYHVDSIYDNNAIPEKYVGTFIIQIRLDF